jgi:hypothetical protein
VTKWEKTRSSPGANDSIGPVYVSADNVVVATFVFNSGSGPKSYQLFGYRDLGASYQELWSRNLGDETGGDVAFGPGATVYVLPQGKGRTIYALSEGAIGDPEEAGMDFLNNRPPNAVTNLSPGNGATDLVASVVLNWQASDPDGHALKYDVFVGDPSVGDGDIPPYVTQITSNSLSVTGLRLGTTYTWQVLASDGQAVTEGPIWTFSTLAGTLQRSYYYE